ncbi:hypothetical protein FRC10_004225 [Ceratobasidium sp. 414]|nr:hypothetical protein FRC10_004225 [Ceratobasidium sp. 414]
MSRATFPNRSRTIPKIEVVEEPLNSEVRAMEDRPDDPGAEMARGARVWRTYVREADRSDKEMVEGRNK